MNFGFLILNFLINFPSYQEKGQLFLRCEILQKLLIENTLKGETNLFCVWTEMDFNLSTSVCVSIMKQQSFQMDLNILCVTIIFKLKWIQITFEDLSICPSLLTTTNTYPVGISQNEKCTISVFLLK